MVTVLKNIINKGEKFAENRIGQNRRCKHKMIEDVSRMIKILMIL